MLKDKPQFRPKLRLPGFLFEVLQTIIFVLVVTVMFDMAIPRSLVEGSSMQPTFEGVEDKDPWKGDRLIVSRIHYLIASPKRGDVIVLNSVNSREPDVMLIKRVIGLPGDHIEFLGHQLYVNDILIGEPYILEDCTSRCPDKEWFLGSGEYFVMGDNRNHSNDSRVFGIVPINHIVGKVLFRYWPLNRIGFIQEPQYPELNK